MLCHTPHHLFERSMRELVSLLLLVGVGGSTSSSPQARLHTDNVLHGGGSSAVGPHIRLSLMLPLSSLSGGIRFLALPARTHTPVCLSHTGSGPLVRSGATPGSGRGWPRVGLVSLLFSWVRNIFGSFFSGPPPLPIYIQSPGFGGQNTHRGAANRARMGTLRCRPRVTDGRAPWDPMTPCPSTNPTTRPE